MNGAKGKVISIKEKSKGFAIIVGARWAAKRKVESILTLDADLRSFRPEVVRELVQDFEKNKHDMVYALTNEPLPNGEYMCDFAHSGQRIIRLSAIKELIKPGSNFEHLLKRKGITFETLITRLIKNQAPHFGEGYIDYRITPFYAKRAAMHGDVVKKKEQFHNINLMLRYLRRYKQPIEQGVLAKKRLVRKIKR
jgi:glycosyltransferase involved in cell wall biosynthesis